MAASLKSGTCKNCGAWTGHGHRKLCPDCVKKAVKPLVPCQYQDCTQTFKPGSGAKFCMLHRGLRTKKAA